MANETKADRVRLTARGADFLSGIEDIVARGRNPCSVTCAADGIVVLHGGHMVDEWLRVLNQDPWVKSLIQWGCSEPFGSAYDVESVVIVLHPDPTPSFKISLRVESLRNLYNIPLMLQSWNTCLKQETNSQTVSTSSMGSAASAMDALLLRPVIEDEVADDDVAGCFHWPKLCDGRRHQKTFASSVPLPVLPMPSLASTTSNAAPVSSLQTQQPLSPEVNLETTFEVLSSYGVVDTNDVAQPSSSFKQAQVLNTPRPASDGDHLIRARLKLQRFPAPRIAGHSRLWLDDGDYPESVLLKTEIVSGLRQDSSVVVTGVHYSVKTEPNNLPADRQVDLDGEVFQTLPDFVITTSEAHEATAEAGFEASFLPKGTLKAGGRWTRTTSRVAQSRFPHNTIETFLNAAPLNRHRLLFTARPFPVQESRAESATLRTASIVAVQPHGLDLSGGDISGCTLRSLIHTQIDSVVIENRKPTVGLVIIRSIVIDNLLTPNPGPPLPTLRANIIIVLDKRGVAQMEPLTQASVSQPSVFRALSFKASLLRGIITTAERHFAGGVIPIGTDTTLRQRARAAWAGLTEPYRRFKGSRPGFPLVLSTENMLAGRPIDRIGMTSDLIVPEVDDLFHAPVELGGRAVINLAGNRQVTRIVL